MFAESACAVYGTDAARNRKLLQSAAQASLREAANMAVMQPSLTSRETQIVLRNPYKPLTDVSRVPGLNAWPRRRLRNPRYYGFGGVPQAALAPVRIAPNVFNGFGSLLDELPPPPPAPIYQPSTSSGNRLTQILDAIRATLPATISAIKGQPYYDPNAGGNYGAPVGSYSGTGQRYTGSGTGTDIGARAGSAVGGLGDTIGAIVRDHPYATLAAGAGVILLFMKPPSRRR